jgi:carboxyl-terminal processing protease
LARQLLSEDADLGVMRMREAEQRFKVIAGENPFTGKVAILINHGTASTSEIFAQALQDLGRATVVGTSDSLGAALPSVMEELDSGAVFQYVVADYTSPKGIAVEGRGVAPDIHVKEDIADLAQGRDALVERAIAHLGGA